MKGKMSVISKVLQVFLVFGVLFAYAMFQGGFVSWFLFYSFLPIVLYLFLLVLYPISKWSVSRGLSKRIVRAGEQVDVQLEIRRKFAFPIFYVVVEEAIPSTLHYKSITGNSYDFINRPDMFEKKTRFKRVVFPLFKRVISLNYSLDDIPRGEHQLTTVRVRVGDFFGFIQKEHSYMVTSYLLAYPSTRPVRLRGINNFDEGASPAYNVQLKNTTVVNGVRQYMPGDRFSWIDWKTTARKSAIMTKEFEQEKTSNIMVVLDALKFDGLNKIAFEAGVELSASLIEFFRYKNAALSFLSIEDKQVYFSLDRNQEKHELVRKHLAKVQPIDGEPFAEQLMVGAKMVSRGFVSLLVVGHLNQGLLHSVNFLKKISKRIVIYLIKPATDVTTEDKEMIQQLSASGILVRTLTEEQLSTKEFEVNM